MRRFPLLAVFLVLAAPAFGQGADMQPLFTGKEFPLHLQLKDLNADWQRIRVEHPDQTGGLSDLLKQLLQMGMMASASHNGAGAKPDPDTIMGLIFLSSLLGGPNGSSTVYYTKGQTRTFGGETFLVAYRLEAQQPDLAKLMVESQQSGGQMPDISRLLAPKRSPADTLTLTLLNVKAVSSLSDIRPFDLELELGDSDNTLASVLLPVFQKAQEKAKEVSSLSYLKQIALGTMMYMQDYDENFPPMNDYNVFKKAVMPYVKNETIFINPITNEPYHINARLSKKNLAVVESPATMAMIYEASPAPDGTRGVCYVDGHANRVPDSEWPQVKKASGMP